MIAIRQNREICTTAKLSPQIAPAKIRRSASSVVSGLGVDLGPDFGL